MMTTMQKGLTIIILVAHSILGRSTLVLANEIEDDTAKADRSKLDAILDLLRSDDVAIVFYGQVVDQAGTPISGAIIELNVSRYSDDEVTLYGGSKRVELVTDENGQFVVDGERGSGLFIKNISKLGYDGFNRLNSGANFNYGSDIDGPIHVPNKQSPIVFQLRRKDEGTFCINNENMWIEINHRSHDYSAGYDFIQRLDVYDIRRTSLNGNPLVCDLFIKAQYQTNSGVWVLIFSSQGANGGIYWTDQRLYQAPESEYRTEYTYVATNRSVLSNRFMYIKSRDPAIYTRVEIESVGVDPDLVRFNAKEAVTNPYGDRNFELHSELSWEMITQLTAEVENAFRVGKRPVKPDIKAMIEAARGD